MSTSTTQRSGLLVKKTAYIFWSYPLVSFSVAACMPKSGGPALHAETLPVALLNSDLLPHLPASRMIADIIDAKLHNIQTHYNVNVLVQS